MNAAILEMTTTLVNAIADANKIQKQANVVATRKQGVYTVFTKCAAENGAVDFKLAIDNVFAAIRENKDGLAESTKCPANKKGDGFVIPGAAMSAKSVLLGAFEHNVSLLNDKDTGDEYKAFSQIRKDLATAKALELDSKRTPAERDAAEMIARLRASIDAIEAHTESNDINAELSELADTLELVAANLNGDTETEADAADLAELAAVA